MKEIDGRPGQACLYWQARRWKKVFAESIKQPGVTDHRFLMSGRERFSQLPMHHEMMAGFYHQMDVDEKILIFDGDLDAIT